jgi:hypothetical protein
MADVLGVIFDRWDRHPNVHEYGKAIDRYLDRLAGGSGRIRRGGSDPRVPIEGFAARLDDHGLVVTGPRRHAQPTVSAASMIASCSCTWMVCDPVAGLPDSWRLIRMIS